MTSIDTWIISEASEHYRHLHQYPELSFQEEQTYQYICGVLRKHGIAYETVGNTSVIGFIPGQHPTHTVALRADTDALPLQENSCHPYPSQHPGIMHACGHDVHTACLLGAAIYLKQHQASLPVNIMLIFQAAEEVLPGGALEILQSSFFNSHYPEWIIAQHAEPDLPVGSVGLCPGSYMASGDEIYITLEGPGGHAALPDKSVDLVLIASHIVVALQQITSRHASPFMPTILTFGNVRCQSAMNIIPKEIVLEGTFRTFDENWRRQAKIDIENISSAIAHSMGAKGKTEIITGYPSLYNNPEKAAHTLRILESEFGKEHVILLSKRMTTEDFARYSQCIPATFIRLGVQGKQPSGKLHTPEFYADPEAFSYGIRTLCSLAMSSSVFITHC